ncbi:MAG: dipeptidase PepE [Candidatus Latescibacterota bacterium]|nr:MAG: dipeptidase PepE [Candidatus Latescibacterota bacterium]
MGTRRLLLLSNSTNFGGGFLEHATDAIQSFLGADVHELLFIPFAAVRFSYDAFAARVQESLAPMGYRVRSIHTTEDAVAAVGAAEAIVVGGGNTFRLLELLYRYELLEPIRKRVRSGVPYVGWSAGSNVACPSVRTTNDMPITEPPSLSALNLVPFQINPHYTDAAIPEHGGETRAERLQEFVAANPGMPVLALREGSTLRVEGESWTLLGERSARVFGRRAEPIELAPGATLDALRA